MRFQPIRLLRTHGWRIVFTVISALGTAIGATYAYGLSEGRASGAIEVTQQDVVALKTSQNDMQHEVSSVKADVARVEGKVDTVINMLQRRRN